MIKNIEVLYEDTDGDSIIKVDSCVKCIWSEDCSCVVCEDAGTVFCLSEHKHVSTNNCCKKFESALYIKRYEEFIKGNGV